MVHILDKICGVVDDSFEASSAAVAHDGVLVAAPAALVAPLGS